MSKVVHIIGNGPSASLYDPRSTGLKYTCNLPPFAVPDAKATFMVDFKMMKALYEGSVQVPGNWILGYRPKKWMEMKPGFYMKYAAQIKEFYTEKPDYVDNYTDFNCGHMAVHYAANKLKADEIHMYGFDSIFDPDLRSCTDFYLSSDRSAQNSTRLAGNWRPIWSKMFKEFSNTRFVLYHFHDKTKTPLPSNATVKAIPKKKK